MSIIFSFDTSACNWAGITGWNLSEETAIYCANNIIVANVTEIDTESGTSGFFPGKSSNIKFHLKVIETMKGSHKTGDSFILKGHLEKEAKSISYAPDCKTVFNFEKGKKYIVLKNYGHAKSVTLYQSEKDDWYQKIKNLSSKKDQTSLCLSSTKVEKHKIAKKNNSTLFRKRLINLKIKCHKKDGEACYKYADIIRKSKGLKEYNKYFNLSLKYDYPYATFFMGIRYKNGWYGTKKDPSKAKKLFQKCLTKYKGTVAYNAAKFQLGSDKRLNDLKAKCNKKDGHACFVYAVSIKDSIGLKEYDKYHNLSIKYDYPFATYSMGLRYKSGTHGTKKDLGKAKEWFQKCLTKYKGKEVYEYAKRALELME